MPHKGLVAGQYEILRITGVPEPRSFFLLRTHCTEPSLHCSGLTEHGSFFPGEWNGWRTNLTSSLDSFVNFESSSHDCLMKNAVIIQRAQQRIQSLPDFQVPSPFFLALPCLLSFQAHSWMCSSLFGTGCTPKRLFEPEAGHVQTKN